MRTKYETRNGRDLPWLDLMRPRALASVRRSLPHIRPGDLLGQCARVKITPERKTSDDFTRGRIDDGPLPSNHRRRFMLYWAALASDALRARKWAMSIL